MSYFSNKKAHNLYRMYFAYIRTQKQCRLKPSLDEKCLWQARNQVPKVKTWGNWLCSSYLKSAQERFYHEKDPKPVVSKCPSVAGQLPPSVIVSDGVEHCGDPSVFKDHLAYKPGR